MKRDDIWWVNFDPSVGGEIRKKRPAVIVSNNAANNALACFRKALEINPGLHQAIRNEMSVEFIRGEADNLEM